jgi:serine/threonine protein kinase
MCVTSDFPNLEFIVKIASGAYGSVHKARDRATGDIVVVKLMSDSSRELSVLSELEHPNIVKLKGRGASGVVLEWCPYSLRDVIDSARPQPPQVAAMARQLLAGLACLHSQGIVHCDIKPENILCTRRSDIKITDFGVAHAAGAVIKGRWIGTLGFQAPEALAGTIAVTPAIDIWAAGCVIFELITATPLFDPRAPPSAGAAAKIRDARLPPEWESLLESMLATDPADRPSADEALRHPVLARDVGELPMLVFGEMRRTVRPKRAHRRPIGPVVVRPPELVLAELAWSV